MKKYRIGYYIEVEMPGVDASDAGHRAECANPVFDTFIKPGLGTPLPLVEGFVRKAMMLHAHEVKEDPY